MKTLHQFLYESGGYANLTSKLTSNTAHDKPQLTPLQADKVPDMHKHKGWTYGHNGGTRAYHDKHGYYIPNGYEGTPLTNKTKWIRDRD